MAYNPAVDATALRAEVVLNQVHYGDLGSTKTVLAKLNTKTADVAICRTPADSSARAFTGEDLMFVVATAAGGPQEYVVAVTGHVDSAYRMDWYDYLTREYRESPIPVRFHTQILAVFSTGDAPNVRAQIILEATGPQAMAEVLFGDDSIISTTDYFDALGPPDAPTLMDAAQQQQYVDDYMDHYQGTERTSERIRITALAATKEAPGQTVTWS